jgi:hypothetical protein
MLFNEDVPTPCPAAGQVLVRIRAAVREPAIQCERTGGWQSRHDGNMLFQGFALVGTFFVKRLETNSRNTLSPARSAMLITRFVKTKPAPRSA